MTTIEAIVRSINREFVPQFEERLRAILAEQDREWLIDQIVRLTLDAHSLEEIDRRVVVEAKARARAERLGRVRELGARPTPPSRPFSAELAGTTREDLIAAVTWPPTRRRRAPRSSRPSTGPRPARRCSPAPRTSCSRCSSATTPTNTHLDRVQQELLTMALPDRQGGGTRLHARLDRA